VCPNCHNVVETSIAGKVNSSRIKDLFKNSRYCQLCIKNGSGKFELRVKKCDWEKDTEAKQDSAVPARVTEVDQEILQKNIARELKLREKEKVKG
jgi:hypothetical protein